VTELFKSTNKKWTDFGTQCISNLYLNFLTIEIRHEYEPRFGLGGFLTASMTSLCCCCCWTL